MRIIRLQSRITGANKHHSFYAFKYNRYRVASQKSIARCKNTTEIVLWIHIVHLTRARKQYQRASICWMLFCWNQSGISTTGAFRSIFSRLQFRRTKMYLVGNRVINAPSSCEGVRTHLAGVVLRRAVTSGQRKESTFDGLYRSWMQSNVGCVAQRHGGRFRAGMWECEGVLISSVWPPVVDGTRTYLVSCHCLCYFRR